MSDDLTLQKHNYILLFSLAAIVRVDPLGYSGVSILTESVTDKLFSTKNKKILGNSQNTGLFTTVFYVSIILPL